MVPFLPFFLLSNPVSRAAPSRAVLVQRIAMCKDFVLAVGAVCNVEEGVDLFTMNEVKGRKREREVLGVRWGRGEGKQ